MRLQALRAMVLLCGIPFADAFTGFILNARAAASRTLDRYLVMSTPSRTRRGLLLSSSQALGVVLGSTFLPNGALAANAPQRKGINSITCGWPMFLSFNAHLSLVHGQGCASSTRLISSSG